MGRHTRAGIAGPAYMGRHIRICRHNRVTSFVQVWPGRHISAWCRQAGIRVGQVTKWSFAHLSQSLDITAIIFVRKYLLQWLASSIPLTTSTVVSAAWYGDVMSHLEDGATGRRDRAPGAVVGGYLATCCNLGTLYKVA